MEKLAQRQIEKLKDLEDMETQIEEERLSLEEQISRLEAIFEHQELSKELKEKPYRKVSLPQQKDT